MGTAEVWILCLIILTMAGLALWRFERTTTIGGKILTGAAAMILGIVGLLMLAALVFG